jgi:hypothetical protein
MNILFKKRKIYLFVILILLFFLLVNYSQICFGEAADTNLGCFDTDEGKNYYKKGEASDFLTTTPSEDYCTKNGQKVLKCIPSDGDENCGISEKYCTNYQRVSGGYLSGENFLTICPYGCQDGACILPDEMEENSCFDSEEKKNYTNKGEAVALGGIAMEEYCQDSERIMEYFCENNDVYSTLYFCPNGCHDGACIDINQYQKPGSECNETDEGDDVYNYGYVYDTGTRNTDECFGSELLEYYCENGEKKHKKVICENGCVDGACLKEEMIEEIAPTTLTNPDFVKQLKGKIILKVEDKGKAFYINPQGNTIHYLGRPDDAFEVMRNQGIGISNANLEKIPMNIDNSSGLDTDGDGLSDLLEDAIGTNKKLTDSDDDGFDDKQELISGYNPKGNGRVYSDNNFVSIQLGKIFLQVENNGEAWYVNPEDGKRYFLGRPADAFNIMRSFGLGISNNNFNSL